MHRLFERLAGRQAFMDSRIRALRYYVYDLSLRPGFSRTGMCTPSPERVAETYPPPPSPLTPPFFIDLTALMQDYAEVRARIETTSPFVQPLWMTQTLAPKVQ